MKDDPASLRNLHDLVPPAEIGWWPLAPGWYFVGTLFFVIAVWLGLRFWRQWQGDAYRRAALKELEKATETVEVAAILRRTALASVQRGEVAPKTGDDWTNWLATCLPEPMPEEVRRALGTSLYGAEVDSRLPRPLREYAARWIRHHSFDPDRTKAMTSKS